MIRSSLLVLAALLLLPGTALAGGTVAVDGQRLVITGTPGLDTAVVASVPASNEILVMAFGSDQSTRPNVVGAGCKEEDRYREGFTKIWCQAAGINEIAVDTGAGDDHVNLQASIPTRVDAGAGDDIVETYGGPATIRFGDGDDSLDATKPTTAFGEGGDDDLGCGDAKRVSGRGVRVLDGGAGKDRACGSRGDDRLSGGAGDDKLYTGEGEDRLDGGAGDDTLDGGDENDTITGGRGEDEIDAGSGKDVIRAKDRETDDVACGSKRDTVFADRIDDLFRCEIVRR
jgi:Ca2+-binding RTX toxin-like protein